MAVALPVYKQRRVVLVRFERARTGDPHESYPDPDDRGWTNPEHGTVVGLMAGATASLKLTRERIDNAAELYVTSADTATVLVTKPAKGKLPKGRETDVELKGVAGGNPKTATIQVRFGSATGPVVHQLGVHVYTVARLRITPHMVSIASSSAAAIASTANIATIISRVGAIWKPCGLRFDVQPTVSDSFTFATAGQVAWGAEVNRVLSASYVPNTINAYFVNAIDIPGSPGVLGLGFSRAIISTFSLPNPGIILADTNVAGTSRATDPMWIANDLAHGIGHFLRLEHCERRQPPNEREDLWSRRSLMHNYNSLPRLADWQNDPGYGTDASGNPRRGCFVSQKDLTQLTTDGEAALVRTTVATGPY